MFAFLISFAFSVLYAKHEEKSFLSWMRTTNQIYTGDEYHLRFGIFLTNLRRIQEFNSANDKRSFRVGLNKFSCYTPSEYKVLLGFRRKPIPNRQKIITKKMNDPDQVDWRDKGVVNAVKNQGQCGSCWAFGSVQACESSYAIKYGTLYTCSEQNLVDCVANCYGCNGGFISSTFNYILLVQNGLLNLEKDYPYKAEEDTCVFNLAKGVNKILSFEQGVAHDEDYLKSMVAKGVCAIGIDASQWSFQTYSGGVYDESECSSEFLDHAVGLVGYGSENGVDYWIVRNSWGPDWGEKGYIRMSRNKDNQCGVATETYLVHT